MTDLELLDNAINTLGSIQLPVAYIQSATLPIYNVRQDLIALSDAIKKHAEGAAPEEEPVLEIAGEEPAEN